MNTNTELTPERLPLQFVEVYSSEQWKKLDPLSRVQLMLVAEGAKPGTFINGDFTNFPEVVEKMGLEKSLMSEPNVLDPTYAVGKPFVMENSAREALNLPSTVTSNDRHRFSGKFLGYPDCCIEEYNNPQKNMVARSLISKTYESNFDFELEKMIAEGKAYPPELDFRPPSFTPCSATCPEALQLLKTWKDIMENGDPEAAKELQIHNWKNSPTGKVHSEKLTELESKNTVIRRNELLRSSIGEVLE